MMVIKFIVKICDYLIEKSSYDNIKLQKIYNDFKGGLL